MKAHVDENVCVGSSACEDICPEAFEVVGGTSRVKLAQIPEELRDKVREAADACPVGAISIVEE